MCKIRRVKSFVSFALVAAVLVNCSGPGPRDAGMDADSGSAGGLGGGMAPVDSGSTGGGGGATGGSGGGFGGGAGGGTGGGADGPCTASEIPVTFNTDCTHLARGACGGAVAGSWCYTDYCIDPVRLFPDVQAVCSAVSFSQLDGRINSAVRFSGGTTGFVARGGTMWVTGAMSVPSDCVPSGWSCAQLGPALKDFSLDAGCAPIAQGCLCGVGKQFRFDFAVKTQYLTAGTVLYLDAGMTNAPVAFDYCVATDGLHVMEAEPRARVQLRR